MYIKPFAELSKLDAAIAGGKGASLGEMTQAGIPVPPGFVVLAGAFDHFVRGAQLEAKIEDLLQAVQYDQVSSIEQASEQIRTLIAGAEMPRDIADEIMRSFRALDVEFVAVRSSATSEDAADAAWAGQLESYLNTTEVRVLDHVKKCWASLFTPRAIFYRHEKQLYQHIAVAVVVQAMVNSEVSGVAFSVHPVTQDRNQMVIEASYGLGEAIVSGQVTPDSFVIEKAPKRVAEQHIAAKKRGLYRIADGGNEWREVAQTQANEPSLTNEQALTLADLVMRIEAHYGFPCDIEWALEKGRFYIVQSRPITTLVHTEKKRIFEKNYTRDNALASFQIWHKNQTQVWKTFMGWAAPSFLLDAKEGVTDVYYEPDAFAGVEENIGAFLQVNAALQKFLDEYQNYLDQLEPIWLARTPLQDKEALLAFWELAVKGWSGMSLSYFIPTLPAEKVADAQRKQALKLRERAGAYFEDTDRIIQETLKQLFPELKGLTRYLTIEEIAAGALPAKELLEQRRQHFIFFEDRVVTGVSLEHFCRERGLSIHRVDVPKDATAVQGQTAMGGIARGKVRIILKKELLHLVEDGEILVTAMTTPDFLPAMQKAAAFVTDEGGITCHAAIVAREMGKPCVIGTKFATEVLRDGDEVEVDADVGAVRLIARNAAFAARDVRTLGIFERVVQFPAIPVLYFEAMLGCYERNPLAESLGIHYTPTTVYAMDQQLEGWIVPATKVQVTDQHTIEAIDRAMLDLNETAQRALRPIIERPLADYDANALREAIIKVNQISTDIYCGFIFFTDELLYPTDEAHTHHLQQTRMVIDRLVTECLFKAYEVLVRALTEVYGLDAGVVERATTEELLRLLSGTEMKREVLVDRPVAFVSVKGTRHVFTGVEASESIRFLHEQDPSQSQLERAKSSGVLTGRVGHKGKVTGRVRILLAADYQNQVVIDALSKDEGYVLVTPMTRPELVPHIGHASAFVTDEGGITCHAAIIAREMNKPCIIGTQFATQMLRDGDVVEVDADTGTVTVLQ